MRYLLNRLNKLNFKKMFEIVNNCSKKSGKSKIIIFFDMIWCALAYKCGYADYEFLEMYSLSKIERKNVVTAGINNVFVKRLNPKENWCLVDDKYLFNERFKDFLGRSFMKITGDNFDEFKSFVKDKEYIMVKPIAATWGLGVEKVKVTGDLKKLYDKLLSNNQCLVEEIAVQHKDIAKLHKDSINTIRIVTIRNEYGVVSIVCSIIRMGTGHNVVDNFHNGGIYCPIDIKTGRINGSAISKGGERYEVHPTSKVKLIGYQIPNWDKIIDTVIKAHNLIPELGYIGWDVYVTEKGAGFIEGNEYPGHVLYKEMKQENGLGILPVLKEALVRKK